MTNTEASIRMHNLAVTYSQTNADISELFTTAARALEKQIGVKPTVREYHQYSDYRCPTCNKHLLLKDETGNLDGYQEHFCPDCGQRLDWGEDNACRNLN